MSDKDKFDVLQKQNWRRTRSKWMSHEGKIEIIWNLSSKIDVAERKSWHLIKARLTSSEGKIDVL